MESRADRSTIHITGVPNLTIYFRRCHGFSHRPCRRICDGLVYNISEDCLCCSRRKIEALDGARVCTLMPLADSAATRHFLSPLSPRFM